MTEKKLEGRKTGFRVPVANFGSDACHIHSKLPQLPRETLWTGWIRSWVWPTPPTSAHIVTENMFAIFSSLFIFMNIVHISWDLGPHMASAQPAELSLRTSDHEQLRSNFKVEF